MPQMAPSLWLMSLMVLWFILLSQSANIYFCKSAESTTKTSKVKKSLVSWPW